VAGKRRCVTGVTNANFGRLASTAIFSMDLNSVTRVAVAATEATTTPTAPIPEEEEYYSSWSLFLVCMLLILSLWTSYYLQIKRIRVVHETLVSIGAGMFVGLIVRLSPGEMIKEMLVSTPTNNINDS
jgi:sodium/hydrogen exchanger-like protein 6/7